MRNIYRAGVIILLVLMARTLSAQVPIQTTTFWESSEEDMYSTGMVWRDCNNDGYIDGFFSNGNDIVRSQNYIYLSHYGTLLSSASWYSADYEYSGHCAVGDVDDNGFPDLAVSNFLGSGGFSTPNLSILYNNINGLPNHAPDWHTGDSMYTFSCALGDVDGDGDLDLAIGNGEGYNSIYERDVVYFNVNGVLQTTPGWLSTSATTTMDITWGDVDNDDDLDLALCYNAEGVAIHYNNGGVLEGTPSWQSTNQDPANTIILGDVNNDGWLDIIVAFNDQLGGSGEYSVYINMGFGEFDYYPSWYSSDGGYGSALALYDYDHDGDDDLAAGRWWDRPRIYENLGDSFTSNPVWRGDYATVVEELAWVDIDGDGVEELADSFYVSGDKKLYYTSRHPLFSVDSVTVNDVALDLDDYCYNTFDGWISLGSAPSGEVVIFYKYSFKNDLTVANWDTYNQAYGNSNKPYVDFYADTTFGWAPLTIQFNDSSVGASAWLYHFGDEDTSTVQNPLHTFQNGGIFDVRLDNLLYDGWHNRTQKMMIIALADTLFMPIIHFNAGDTIKLSVYLRNNHPVKYMVLPIEYPGPMDFNYLGFDTDSCRTDYFDQVKMIGFSPLEKKMTFSFLPALSGGNPPLEPGYGRLINIYLQHTSGSGTNVLDTTDLAAQYLNIDADYMTYAPYVKTGILIDQPYLRGDANLDGLINIFDITYLISYLYKEGPPPDPYTGNVDGIDPINIFDITYLISYLYREGPPPPP